MNALKMLAAQSKAAGMQKGESAASFAKRDPQAAAKLASFIQSNSIAIILELSQAVQK